MASRKGIIRRPEEPASGGRSSVSKKKRDSAVTARWEGVIDVSTAEQLHRKVLELAGSGQDVHISLEGAERLDASALQSLLALRQDLLRRGRTISLSGQRPEIQNYLEMAGVATLLAEEAAVRSPSTANPGTGA